MRHLLPTLLKKYESITRDLARLEVDLAGVRAQILGAGRVAPPRARRVRSTHADIVEIVRPTLQVLQEADSPLPCSEIAARLGVSSWVTRYRLQKATKMKLIENVGGRYRVTDAVPALG